MSKRVREQGGILSTLATAKPKLVRSIIKGADRELIQCICECAYNVLKGNVSITPAQRAKLCKYKNGVRELVKKSTSVKRKRQLIQRGGFLSALLGPLIGTVIPAIAGLFAGKK